MTPETTSNAPESPTKAEEWLSVAAAARRLELSERTIQRKAARGELLARTVSDEQGKRLLIRFDLPTPADRVPTPSHAQKGEAADTLARPADKLATGADTSLTAHLVEENRFLRGVIEQLQRDGAETRSALREALRAMPKQLLQGTSETPGTAPQRAPNTEVGRNGGAASSVAKTGAKSLSYGEIADELDRILSG